MLLCCCWWPCRLPPSCRPLDPPTHTFYSALLSAQVMEVKQNKQSYQEMNLSEEQRAAIEAMTEEGDIYTRLASSIAPGVWVHRWGWVGGQPGRS